MGQRTISFSVDAKLLEELGERLVGKPHIALGELVKNAYDADATFTKIVFSPDKELGPNTTDKGEIVVSDDGHGMTFDEFRDFWMRVGTTHKAEKETSPYYGRWMTGSKGVGRLSVQFLARRLELKTVPMHQNEDVSWIWAYVDWDEAVNAGDMTSATVVYEIRTDEPPFEHGTELRLEGLKQSWDSKDLKNLAREIWWLQPPFRRDTKNLSPAERFEIQFVGNEDAVREFQEQLTAIERIQIARVVGKYKKGSAKVAIEFWQRGTRKETYTHEYRLKDIALEEYQGKFFDPDRNLYEVEFEIRIYKSEGKQPTGIRVKDLQDYLERFAGVHVYDGPFRLPYYGKPENDWLNVEYDHAHRQFVSRLLPKEIDDAFKETERLRYLPTLRRMIGVVRTNTSKERNLQISITRDRFIESQAQEDLRWIVRYALDLYSYHAARRAFLERRKEGKTEKPSEILRQVEDALAAYRSEIPAKAYRKIEDKLRQATKSIGKVVETEKDTTLRNLSLLAPLATAGISAVAVQHELRKQLGRLDEIVTELQELSTGDPGVDAHVSRLASDLREWANRARKVNALFDYVRGGTIRETERYRAKFIIEHTLEQMVFMSKGVTIDTDRLDENLYLPEASLAEWGAIFQNVFSNAFNAMLGMERRMLSISSNIKKERRALLIQDTGKGVNLDDTERLFEPFQRGMDDDPVRLRMGFGGTGLGLTIVRLLSNKIGCIARFVKPEDGFSTAFILEWQEKIARR